MDDLVVFFMLYNLWQQHEFILQAALQQLNIIAYLGTADWKSIKAFKYKLQRRNRRTGPYGRNKSKRKRNSGKITDYDVYECTGLYQDDFEEVYGNVRDAIRLPRNNGTRITKTSMSPMLRLMVVLQYLRQHLRFATIKQLYDTSKTHTSNDLWHIIPKLYVRLNEINLPLFWNPHLFEQVSGSIDCSSHFRYRVHPRQGEWYRYDKHGFFFSAQVIVDLRGIILHVKLGMGHNNDKAMLNMSGFKEYLCAHGVRWLADGGYSFEYLVTPNKHKSASWNNMQKALRSVVETTIGMVKLYRLAAERVTISPELQSMCLMICYQLTNLILKQFPLRPLEISNKM